MVDYDAETWALTGSVTRWLVSVLTDSGVQLPGDEARLRTIVHGTVARAIGLALPYRHGKLNRDLHACFAAPPDRELPLGATAEDLRKAIAARIEDMVRGESFYASYYRNGLLTQLLHDALVQAMQEFLARGPGVDAAQAARLNALGVDVDSPELVVRNEVGGGFSGNLVQAAVVHGDVRINAGDEEPDTPIFVRVEAEATLYRHCEDPPDVFMASGSGVINVLVEAKGARAVTLRSLRAVVLSRRPPQPTPVVTTVLGIMTPRHFEVNLDADVPRLVPVNRTGRSGLGRLIRRWGGSGFPYTVSPLDPEMFVVEPRTAKYQVEWCLELDWTYRGRDGTTLIDDSGTPFKVMAPYRP
ncbi:hypothetical protein GCM10010492_60450 [Saccharothrix mutabilis subsp. mutabilis]|uniref:Uncharacterized protein n=1 Tax=Saccharothrix mutabilis subsp. mutabilis TaxID=66855 RepID=A0ABN0UIP5_9PSEU